MTTSRFERARQSKKSERSKAKWCQGDDDRHNVPNPRADVADLIKGSASSRKPRRTVVYDSYRLANTERDRSRDKWHSKKERSGDAREQSNDRKSGGKHERLMTWKNEEASDADDECDDAEAAPQINGRTCAARKQPARETWRRNSKENDDLGEHPVVLDADGESLDDAVARSHDHLVGGRRESVCGDIDNPGERKDETDRKTQRKDEHALSCTLLPPFVMDHPHSTSMCARSRVTLAGNRGASAEFPHGLQQHEESQVASDQRALGEEARPSRRRPTSVELTGRGRCDTRPSKWCNGERHGP